MSKFKNKTQFKMGLGFNDPWTKVPNVILDEKDISAKALGIYVKIIRFQNSSKHKIYIGSLANELKEGTTAIRSAIHELINLGYIEREIVRNEKGHVNGYCYVVHAFPVRESIENTTSEPSLENPITDNPISDGTMLKRKYNKKKINKKENKVVVVVKDQNTLEEKVINLYKEMKLEKRVMPHTIKLIKDYINLFDYEIFKEVFISASGNNVDNPYKYMKKIFSELEKKNIRTIEEYRLDEEKYKHKKNGLSKTDKPNINDKNSISQNKYKKTGFHNFEENFNNYSEDELIKIIEKIQKGKYNNYESDEIVSSREVAYANLVKRFGIDKVNSWSNDSLELRLRVEVKNVENKQ